MVGREELLAAVEAAFAETGAAFPGWPDPHDEDGPADDEYSRVTDPGRWLILGARADAWLKALTELDIAAVERNAEVEWVQIPGPILFRVDLVVPRAVGALPLVVARSRLGNVTQAGVTIGVGDPAVCVTWLPDCGCDACDGGSQYEVDRLDEHMLGIVAGTYRRLQKGERTIEVIDGNGWSAKGLRRRDRVDSILKNPRGWHELRGSPWIGHPPSPAGVADLG